MRRHVHPIELSSERLVICEGKEEHCLVRSLKTRGLLIGFDCLYIGQDGIGGGTGIDGLRAFLIGTQGLTGFRNVNDISIIFDNDEDPDLALKKVRDALVAANTKSLREYSVPNKCWERDDTAEITVSLLSLPDDGSNGCFDTMVMNAVRRIYPDVAACADGAVDCAGASEWSIQKRDKATLRTAIACINKKNPAASLSILWDQQPDLIPSDAEEFGPIHTFLMSA